jgi:hypothetical protein
MVDCCTMLRTSLILHHVRTFDSKKVFLASREPRDSYLLTTVSTASPYPGNSDTAKAPSLTLATTLKRRIRTIKDNDLFSIPRETTYVEYRVALLQRTLTSTIYFYAAINMDTESSDTELHPSTVFTQANPVCNTVDAATLSTSAHGTLSFAEEHWTTTDSDHSPHLQRQQLPSRKPHNKEVEKGPNVNITPLFPQGNSPPLSPKKRS